MTRDVAGRVQVAERRLLRRLTWLAAGSIVKGATAWRIGQDTDSELMSGFGRQFAAWGVVDGVIASFGWRGLRRRAANASSVSAGAAGEAERRARSLRRTLLFNAALDVGYVGIGVWMAGSPRERVRPLAGDGLAIAVQGVVLAVNDVLGAADLRRAVTPN